MCRARPDAEGSFVYEQHGLGGDRKPEIDGPQFRSEGSGRENVAALNPIH